MQSKEHSHCGQQRKHANTEISAGPAVRHDIRVKGDRARIIPAESGAFVSATWWWIMLCDVVRKMPLWHMMWYDALCERYLHIEVVHQ